MVRLEYRHTLPWNSAFFLEWSNTRYGFDGKREDRVARCVAFADDACDALEASRGIALALSVNPLQRDEVPGVVARTTGFEARWRRSDESLPYDGCDRTLLMLDVPARDQLKVLDDLEPQRATLETAVGGPLIIAFSRSK